MAESKEQRAMRVDTALLVIYPPLWGRIIGDTTLRDYCRGRLRPDYSPAYHRYGYPCSPSSALWIGSRAVERRMEATFGPDFRRAPGCQ